MGGSCLEIGNGRLCRGDARELIRTLPDESVDIIITDPPWGVGFDEYDDPNVFFELEDEMWRVLKNDSWLVFFYTPKRILEIGRFKRFKYVWMIPYVFFSFGSVSRNPLGSQASYSIVVVLSKGKPKIVVSRKDVIISDELPIVDGNIKEPQFKPTYVVMELLTMFTRQGDLVLDPFSGYGSIPLVCELYGRRWIAFELDPLKHEISRRILTERKVFNINSLKKSLSREQRGA